MANEQHLRILKEGVGVWNQWRKDRRDVTPDLSKANLRGTRLRGTDLRGTDLVDAILDDAILIEANLAGANLRSANLIRSQLNSAILKGANLRSTVLIEADLSRANLQESDLSGADMRRVNLSSATLGKANLSRAVLLGTIFGDVDLSQVHGLESVRHNGPSTIGIDTIQKSRGRVPHAFLRGCGVPDNFIEYMVSLAGKDLDYYSCFISYSSKDEEVARRIHDNLQGQGVRCWFAPEHMKIGDRIRSRIDEAIRLHDRLLLILSQNSVASNWVEKEVETAFEQERQGKRVVLFPIRIDDTVMETRQAWAADIRRTRHIGDFCGWKNHDAYQKAFDRLLRDLKADQGAAAG